MTSDARQEAVRMLAEFKAHVYQEGLALAAGRSIDASPAPWEHRILDTLTGALEDESSGDENSAD